MLKLDGELAAIERDGDRVLCGGGARLPSAAAKAARWGLTGLEFGVNIPGTVGGAVRMNANAYGGELAAVLEWVDVCDRRGGRPPRARRARLRVPALEPRAGRGRLARLVRARRRRRRERSRRRWPRCATKRREAQPSGIKTFGSTFKNPDDPRAEGRTAGQLLDAAGCRGLEVGGARFSPKHANFVENAGERPPPTSSR